MIKIETNLYEVEEDLLNAVKNWVEFFKAQGYELRDMYIYGVQNRGAVIYFREVVK